jgi:hypothetical protein
MTNLRGEAMEESGKKVSEETPLVEFLVRTKEGLYGKIEESSLKYARMDVQREPDYDVCCYYYSVR